MIEAPRRSDAASLPVLSLVLLWALCSCLITATLACSGPADTPPAPRSAPAPEDTDTVAVVLPGGDAGSGRQAFLDLKCTTCHLVVGETAFPAPLGATHGPDLDRTLRRRPISELAAAIVVPSHSVSLRVSDETKKQLEGMLSSPMGDFSRAMTVRQLADLLAYLRSIDAGP